MFGPTELILLLLIIPLFLILPAIAIIDILKSRFEGNDAVIFVLIVLFVPVLGAILYFVVGRPRRIEQ